MKNNNYTPREKNGKRNYKKKNILHFNLYDTFYFRTSENFLLILYI